jgi:hypothetical protein
MVLEINATHWPGEMAKSKASSECVSSLATIACLLALRRLPYFRLLTKIVKGELVCISSSDKTREEFLSKTASKVISTSVVSKTLGFVIFSKNPCNAF